LVKKQFVLMLLLCGYASCTDGMTRIVGKEAIVSAHVHNVHVTSDMNMLGHVQR